MLTKTLAILAMVSVPATATVAASGDGVISYDQQDLKMNAAQDEARSHLDGFLNNVLDENGVGRQGTGVKVAFPVGGESIEVIWVSPFGMRDGQFIGLLANEPQNMEGYNAGDTVAFNQDQVRDWFFYGEDGKMYGSYTTRVMLPDMSEDTAEELSELLSNDPVPSDW